jgi:hypothetical protein
MEIKKIPSLTEALELKPEIGKIYCDMDGVLVDFDAGARELLVKILDGTAPSFWTGKSRTIAKSLASIKKRLGNDWIPKSHTDIQDPDVKRLMLAAISHEPGLFFSKLEPLQDGIGPLWSFLNSVGLDVHLLTAPINSRAETIGGDAASGKKIWASEYLSPAPSSVIVVKADEKQNFAVDEIGRKNIIVDDREATIEQWSSRGGIAILHEPKNSKKTIDTLRDILGF